MQKKGSPIETDFSHLIKVVKDKRMDKNRLNVYKLTMIAQMLKMWVIGYRHLGVQVTSWADEREKRGTAQDSGKIQHKGDKETRPSRFTESGAL